MIGWASRYLVKAHELHLALLNEAEEFTANRDAHDLFCRPFRGRDVFLTNDVYELTIFGRAEPL